MGVQHWVINIGKTELFSHAHAHSVPRCARPAKCIRNVKCTRRSLSKCKCLLSAVVIYASVENQYSGWALGRSARPCDITARVCARHPGSESYRAVTMGRSNPRRRCRGCHGTLFRPNLYFMTDSAYQWQPRGQGPHHDFQARTKSILIDISLRSPECVDANIRSFMSLVKQISWIQSYLSGLDSHWFVDFGKMARIYKTIFLNKCLIHDSICNVNRYIDKNWEGLRHERIKRDIETILTERMFIIITRASNYLISCL